MAEGGIIELVFRAKLDQLQADVGEGRKKAVKAAEAMGAEMEAGLGDKLSKVGKTVSKSLTPVAATVAATTAVIARDWNAAGKEMAVQTGATGERMDALMGSVRAVTGTVKGGLGAVGDVVSDIAAKTSLAGKPLEELTRKVLQLRELGITLDAGDVTGTLAKWGIKAEFMGGALERLFRLSQSSGQPMDALLGRLADFHPLLTALGFGFEESTLLVSRLSDAMAPGLRKALVDISTAHGDLAKNQLDAEKAQKVHTAAVKKFGPDSLQARDAALKLAEANHLVALGAKEPRQAFDELIASVRNAKTEQDAMAIGMEAFGSKAAAPMVAAIRAGKLELGGLNAKLNENTNTIGETAEAHRTLLDRFSMLKDKAAAWIAPYAEKAATVATIASGVGPAIAGVGKLVGVLTGASAANVAAGSTAAASSTGFFAMAAGVWAAVAPFLLIALAIGALVLVGVLLWKNWDAVLAGGKILFGWIKDAACAALGFLKDNFLYLLGPIGLVIKHWDTFKEAGAKALGWVTDKLGAFVGFVAGIPEKVGGALRGAFDGLIGAFKGAWNWIAGRLNGVGFSIPSWVPGIGGSRFDLPNLPILDDGGIVSKPTLALLAQNSRPEAVVPLDRMGSGGDFGDGGGIVVNQYIAGSVVTERQLAGMSRGSIATVSRHNNGPGF